MIFKRKKIKLDCYTYNSSAYEYASIMQANKFIPSYVKELQKYTEINPPFDNSIGNLRGCVGFNSLYSKGFVIPMWTDVAITVGERGSDKHIVTYADDMTRHDIHPQEQRGSYLPDSDYQHLKIVSPWHFVSNSDVDWYWNSLPWNMDDICEYNVLPAVMKFKTQGSTNINIMLKRDVADRDLIIPFGQPMVHLVPMTESDVEINLHLVSAEEYRDMQRKDAPVSFKSSYLKKAKAKAKCPFHSSFKV